MKSDCAVHLLIESAKIQHDLTDDELASILGISTSTLRRRKSDPAGLTYSQLRILFEMANIPQSERGRYL